MLKDMKDSSACAQVDSKHIFRSQGAALQANRSRCTNVASLLASSKALVEMG